MARDPMIWTDVVELLCDLEDELEDRRGYLAAGEDADLVLRLERVRDVRERLEGEFG